MKEELKKLEELKASIDKIDTKFKELRGGPEMATNSDINNQIWNTCYDMVDGLRQYVYTIADALYKHQNNGHLPPIVGAERMNKALKSTGMDGDYKAEPRTIYSSINRQGNTEFVVDVANSK
jgi:hypothetical protein